MSRAAKIIYHVARVVLGLTFLYAGLIKSEDVTTFAGQVANYKILPYSWNFVVAASVPYVEMIAGFLLLINRRVRPAALVCIGMLVVFMILLGSVILRGLDIDCGCFKPGGQGTSAWVAMGRDAGLLLLSGLVYALRGRFH